MNAKQAAAVKRLRNSIGMRRLDLVGFHAEYIGGGRYFVSLTFGRNWFDWRCVMFSVGIAGGIKNIHDTDKKGDLK